MRQPQAGNSEASLRMRANRRTGGAREVMLRSELHRRGLRFRKDSSLRLGPRPVRPDLVFSGPRVAVFVDGCFWHSCPAHGTTPTANAGYWISKLSENFRRDRKDDGILADAGWTVLRVWEHEIKEDMERVADGIEQIVRSSRDSTSTIPANHAGHYQ